MRWLTLVWCILSLATELHAVTPEDSDEITGTAAWLREGCQLVIAENVGDTAEHKTSPQSAVFKAWMNGFIQGATMMARSSDETAALSKLPSVWSSDKLIALNLLHFVEENKGAIPDYASAEKIMRAWFHMAHPDSTIEQKLFGKVCLIEVTNTLSDGSLAEMNEAQKAIVNQWFTALEQRFELEKREGKPSKR